MQLPSLWNQIWSGAKLGRQHQPWQGDAAVVADQEKVMLYFSLSCLISPTWTTSVLLQVWDWSLLGRSHHIGWQHCYWWRHFWCHSYNTIPRISKVKIPIPIKNYLADVISNTNFQEFLKSKQQYQQKQKNKTDNDFTREYGLASAGFLWRQDWWLWRLREVFLQYETFSFSNLRLKPFLSPIWD